MGTAIEGMIDAMGDIVMIGTGIDTVTMTAHRLRVMMIEIDDTMTGGMIDVFVTVMRHHHSEIIGTGIERGHHRTLTVSVRPLVIRRRHMSFVDHHLGLLDLKAWSQGDRLGRGNQDRTRYRQDQKAYRHALMLQCRRSSARAGTSELMLVIPTICETGNEWKVEIGTDPMDERLDLVEETRTSLRIPQHSQFHAKGRRETVGTVNHAATPAAETAETDRQGIGRVVAAVQYVETIEETGRAQIRMDGVSHVAHHCVQKTTVMLRVLGTKLSLVEPTL